MSPPLCRCPKASEFKNCDMYPEMCKFYDDMKRVGRNRKFGRFSPILAFGIVVLTIVWAVGTAVTIESWGGRI